MDGLSEFLKQITVSRSFTGAALVTSAVLLFGPSYFPGSIPGVPPGWGWAVITVFTFSATLTAFWAISGCWGLLPKAYDNARGLLPLPRPTPEEEMFLFIFADRADDVVNLDDLFHQFKGEMPKLVLLDFSKQLCKKGYIREVGYNENLLTLTDAGRKHCLQLLERRQSADKKRRGLTNSESRTP